MLITTFEALLSGMLKATQSHVRRRKLIIYYKIDPGDLCLLNREHGKIFSRQRSPCGFLMEQNQTNRFRLKNTPPKIEVLMKTRCFYQVVTCTIYEASGKLSIYSVSKTGKKEMNFFIPVCVKQTNFDFIIGLILAFITDKTCLWH